MDLISPEYLATQKWLHAQPRGYGANGDKWASVVAQIAGEIRAQSVLDYGSGGGALGRSLAGCPFSFSEYDPAIDGKDVLPVAADFVVSTDVLEHVEPERAEAVLDHLHDLTLVGLFVVIGIQPTSKTLPDGRNAHIFLPGTEWWLTQMFERFRTVRMLPCAYHKELAALMLNPK